MIGIWKEKRSFTSSEDHFVCISLFFNCHTLLSFIVIFLFCSIWKWFMIYYWHFDIYILINEFICFSFDFFSVFLPVCVCVCVLFALILKTHMVCLLINQSKSLNEEFSFWSFSNDVWMWDRQRTEVVMGPKSSGFFFFHLKWKRCLLYFEWVINNHLL